MAPLQLEELVGRLPVVDMRQVYNQGTDISPSLGAPNDAALRTPDGRGLTYGVSAAAVLLTAAAIIGNINPAAAGTSEDDQQARFQPGCKPAPAAAKPAAKVLNKRGTILSDVSTTYTNYVSVNVPNKTMNVTTTTSLPKDGGGRRVQTVSTKVVGCHKKGALFIHDIDSPGTEKVSGQTYNVTVTARHRGKKVKLLLKAYQLRGDGVRAQFQKPVTRSWTIFDREMAGPTA